jgi:hypothetical protein
VRRRFAGPRRKVCGGWRKKGDPNEPDDHSLGRSRGGFSIKLHLDCDANGIPIHFELSAGQAHENSSLIELLNHSGNELFGSDGSPIAWPRTIAGDKGDRAEWIDHPASARRVKARVGRPRFGLINRCFWVAVLSLKHHIQHHH